MRTQELIQRDVKIAMIQQNKEKLLLLRNLLRERMAVESNMAVLQEWGLTDSWEDILNTHVDNTSKQLILNDLIDDKVVYLTIKQDQASAAVTQIGGDIVNLNLNKE